MKIAIVFLALCSPAAAGHFYYPRPGPMPHLYGNPVRAHYAPTRLHRRPRFAGYSLRWWRTRRRLFEHQGWEHPYAGCSKESRRNSQAESSRDRDVPEGTDDRRSDTIGAEVEQ